MSNTITRLREGIYVTGHYGGSGGSGGSGVQDVQINGTSITDSGSGVANIPNSSLTVSGVMTSIQYTKLDGIETGADVTDTINVSAAGAVMYTVQSKTDIEKAQARTNIGAVCMEVYDASASSYAENVLYYIAED